MRQPTCHPRAWPGVDGGDGGTVAAGMETSMNQKILFATVALVLASAGTAVAQQPAATPDKPARHMQLDTNNDGAIDRAEAAASPRLAERFDQVDKDKDGKLAADELPQHRRWRHRGHRGQGAMMKLDIDKDGRISKAEAAAEPKFAERFAKMDFNKDGYADRADFKARMEQRRGECFDKADLNRDGKLSRVEFSNMHEVCGRGMRDGSRLHAGKQQGAVSTK
jgi:Ca2+-binding EF-hand superfamily protein